LLPASFGHHVTTPTRLQLIIVILSFSFHRLYSTINASTLFVTSTHHLILNDHISILTITSTLSASSHYYRLNLNTPTTTSCATTNRSWAK
jgi:hypothetical protein